MEKKAKPRKPLHRDKKTPIKVVTTPKKTIRMKHPSISPPHSTLSFKDDANL